MSDQADFFRRCTTLWPYKMEDLDYNNKCTVDPIVSSGGTSTVSTTSANNLISC